MKSNIPITQITFDFPLHPGALRWFRGAVIESVMKHEAVFKAADVPTVLFHNHVPVLEIHGEERIPEKANNRLYDYPLIQYKIQHRRAEIVGIGQGAQAVQLWLSVIGDQLNIHGKVYDLTIYQHQHERWNPVIVADKGLYRLNKWLPINVEKHRQWKEELRLTERIKLLEASLWGHLLHLSKRFGIEWPKEKLELFISTIDHMSYKDSFGIKKLALDVVIATNLNLPDEIGLGQGVSIGFGKVQRIKKKE